MTRLVMAVYPTRVEMNHWNFGSCGVQQTERRDRSPLTGVPHSSLLCITCTTKHRRNTKNIFPFLIARVVALQKKKTQESKENLI